jgi:hypothetical protein
MNAVGIEVRSTIVVGCTWAVLCGLAVACASGCKTGTAGMKPSWWSFGGSAAADPAELASAPAFEGDVKKPSDSAKPYPTTTTPNGYVLNDDAKAALAGEAAQSQPEIPAAVTYGSTPKPATVASVPAAAAPTTVEPPVSRAESAVAAQVGPYAGIATEPAAAGVSPATPAFSPATPGLSPVPQTAGTAVPGGYPSAPGASFTGPAATAAAPQTATAWSPSPAVPSAAAASAAVAAEGRYGSTSGSRFASLPAAAGGVTSAPPSAGLPATGPAGSSGGLPGGGLDPLPASATTSAVPAAGLAVPAASALPASAGPAFAPAGAQLPASATPPAPARRPDPGYRPGGTSSYRPSRAILADDAAAHESGVRPAAFETPAFPRAAAAASPLDATSP